MGVGLVPGLQLLVISLLLVSTWTLEAFQSETIQTKLGALTGRRTTAGQNNDTVYQFLNIPFAKPPVGDLRFRQPVEYGQWNGTLDATKYGPSCFQDVNSSFTIWYGTSEDCLQLNIYVPFTTSPWIKKSVMVWIHGGGYFFGTASFYDGSMIAVEGDVIVVTVNYRLGFFGFLSLGDETTKGNYGLLDQIQALKWVKENIADYGGNPSDVTIFGESAGGFSVGLLSLIPQNKGLFHRAIHESGTANSLLTLGSPVEVTTETAKALGCQTTNSTILMNCLLEKPADAILTQSTMVSERLCNLDRMNCLIFGPVIDGDLLTRTPVELMSNKTTEAYKFFESLDLMVGNCRMEGSLYLSMLGNNVQYQKDKNINVSIGLSHQYLCDVMSPNIANFYFKNNRKVSQAICKEYYVADNATLQSRAVLDVYSDLFFISDSTSTLNAHINSESSTYQFMYNQVLPFKLGPEPTWYEGPSHAEELYYLFTMEYFDRILPNVTISDSDRLLAHQMRKYWTNFAKSGNPNSAGLPVWSVFTNASKNYMKLSKHDMGVGTDYRKNEMKFWLQTIPNLISDSDTSRAKKLKTDSLFLLIISLSSLNFFINIMLLRY